MVVTLMMAGAAFASTINLPQTGQTKCYDTAGIEIPCAGTGQDGEIQAGVAWPEPRFTYNGDGTMTDNLTGLMWTQDASLGGGLLWQGALDYVAAINAGTYPNYGYTDWRLPNVNELASLFNDNEPNPANWFVSVGFSNVQNAYYWSSTTALPYYSTDYAWLVHILRGVVIGGSKFYHYDVYVLPVRGLECGSLVDSIICLPQTGQTVSYASGDDGDYRVGISWPIPRFNDHGNGTVTDNLTNLMWTKDANLPNGNRMWQEALDYVKEMNNGVHPNFGYTDWRLPNRKELHSLMDYSQYAPALPAGHPFTNAQEGEYWTSTTEAPLPYCAGVVDIRGVVDHEIKSCSYCYYYVWPVRGPETTLNVDIDIKPGGFPNSINLKSKGNVPVAILSSPTFDATTVDQGTVEFADAPALSIGGSPEDVNSDGLLDLVLHFSTQSLNLKPGDTETCLTGKTLSGQEFEGCDSVSIVK
jgi:hypothetical protein